MDNPISPVKQYEMLKTLVGNKLNLGRGYNIHHHSKLRYPESQEVIDWLIKYGYVAYSDERYKEYIYATNEGIERYEMLENYPTILAHKALPIIEKLREVGLQELSEFEFSGVHQAYNVLKYILREDQ